MSESMFVNTRRKIKPVNPDEVISLKETLIPDFVIDIFNKQIAQNWNGHESRVLLKDVVSAVIALKEGYETRMNDDHWFDVEDIYREAGWDVRFDQPAYNERYPAFFIFKKKSKKK